MLRLREITRRAAGTTACGCRKETEAPACDWKLTSEGPAPPPGDRCRGLPRLPWCEGTRCRAPRANPACNPRGPPNPLSLWPETKGSSTFAEAHPGRGVIWGRESSSLSFQRPLVSANTWGTGWGLRGAGDHPRCFLSFHALHPHNDPVS